MNLMRGIDLKKIAEKMNGASGAELKVCFTLDEWALMSGFGCYLLLHWLSHGWLWVIRCDFGDFLLFLIHWLNFNVWKHVRESTQ